MFTKIVDFRFIFVLVKQDRTTQTMENLRSYESRELWWNVDIPGQFFRVVSIFPRCGTRVILGQSRMTNKPIVLH